MTDDTATRAALGVAVAMGIALAAALLLGGGGDRPAPGAGTATAPASRSSQVSFDDTRLLARTRPWIREWNAASEAWAKALAAGRERFVREYSGHTRKMDINSLRIRIAAARIENPRLRIRLQRLGDAYRTQFRAVLAVNEGVISEDQDAAAAALQSLE